jgi:hypothetical protein
MTLLFGLWEFADRILQLFKAGFKQITVGIA